MRAAELRAAAASASRAGDREAARRAWLAVLAETPGDPEAHNALGNLALYDRDAVAAEKHFRAAIEADPGQPALLFNHAAAARGAGMVAAAAQSLRTALEIDPYFVQAIYQLAVLYEEAGDLLSAAQLYRNLVDVAPPEVQADPRFASALAQARSVIDRDNAALAARIDDSGTPPSERMREALDALLGRGRIYVSEPTFLTIPRLPALPFLPRSMTPWLEELEAATDDIERELRAVLAAEDTTQFVPYVANPPGTPANQWEPLDHSPDWGALFLWKHGQKDEDNAARCPVTASIIKRMPTPDLAGRAPNAFFSLLKPKTRIPPHTGVTNARLTCHLPLIVPEGCGFRVGAETREWRRGEAWVFDDTIEHEAWNESDQPRIILIFDVWHPMLEAAERNHVSGFLDIYDQHLGRRTGLTDTL